MFLQFELVGGGEPCFGVLKLVERFLLGEDARLVIPGDFGEVNFPNLVCSVFDGGDDDAVFAFDFFDEGSASFIEQAKPYESD